MGLLAGARSPAPPALLTKAAPADSGCRGPSETQRRFSSVQKGEADEAPPSTFAKLPRFWVVLVLFVGQAVSVFCLGSVFGFVFLGDYLRNREHPSRSSLSHSSLPAAVSPLPTSRGPVPSAPFSRRPSLSPRQSADVRSESEEKASAPFSTADEGMLPVNFGELFDSWDSPFSLAAAPHSSVDGGDEGAPFIFAPADPLRSPFLSASFASELARPSQPRAPLSSLLAALAPGERRRRLEARDESEPLKGSPGADEATAKASPAGVAGPAGPVGGDLKGFEASLGLKGPEAPPVFRGSADVWRSQPRGRRSSFAVWDMSGEDADVFDGYANEDQLREMWSKHSGSMDDDDYEDDDPATLAAPAFFERVGRPGYASTHSKSGSAESPGEHKGSAEGPSDSKTGSAAGALRVGSPKEGRLYSHEESLSGQMRSPHASPSPSGPRGGVAPGAPEQPLASGQSSDSSAARGAQQSEGDAARRTPPSAGGASGAATKVQEGGAGGDGADRRAQVSPTERHATSAETPIGQDPSSGTARAPEPAAGGAAGGRDGPRVNSAGTSTLELNPDETDKHKKRPPSKRSISKTRKGRKDKSHRSRSNDVSPASQGVLQRMWITRERLGKLAKKKLRKFHSAMTRRHVCKYLKSNQQYRVWFTLAVLFGLEWPFYSYSDGGGARFLRALLDQTRSFGPPVNSSSLVRRRYEEFRDCGMPQAFEHGLTLLVDALPSGAELPDVLKAAAQHTTFRKVLFAMGDVHVPFDGRDSLVHVFDMVEDAMGLAWGKDVFLGKEPSANTGFKPFTPDELYYKYIFAFSESRRYFSMVLLLSRAMRQHVSQKPHNGIILLLVEQPQVLSGIPSSFSNGSNAREAPTYPAYRGSGLRRLSAQWSSPSGRRDPGAPLAGREPLVVRETDQESFQRLQDFQLLQEQVRQSVLMKLESAIVRFYPTSKTIRRDIVTLPDVRVSGFFARSAEGRTHEKGLAGLEIDFDLMEKFKKQTPPNGVLIQVTLLDSWATQPIEKWPDVMDPSKTLVSSYTATQLLKSELMWDQSLSTFEWGRTKFIYSTISEVFEYEKIDIVNRIAFDPDIQVMLLQSYSDFAVNGKEEGMLAKIVEVLQRKPLGHSGVPREFSPDRIVLQGTATPLDRHGGGKGPLYRKMQFGAGIDYAEVLEVEKAIREHTIMLHIKIVGLGHAAAEDWRGLKAHEILNRLAQRFRGTFEIHYVNPGKPPQSPQIAARSAKCATGIPEWILAVAVLATASFFVIFIILLMYHRQLDVPWWLSCWCSRFSPWEKDACDKGSNCSSDTEDSTGEGDPDHSSAASGADDESGKARLMTHITEEEYAWADDSFSRGAPRQRMPGSGSASFDHAAHSGLRSPYVSGPKSGGGGRSSSAELGAVFSPSSSTSSLGVPRSGARGYDDPSMGHPVTPPSHLNSIPVVRTPTLTKAVSRRLGAESGFVTPTNRGNGAE
ncbi:hypothetical protein BESB_053670 [Besnoitia besnoiti]|uniref:Transmembrane protein n=1 Tax=Besnoitia besnoiti TaxID=94643 RepID=A0A2A9MIC8_BESBE|nr:hypothetical protein BESB_053670 [Besnoitia besnoiti]PFH35716.1 hypothetical protein BESB_053670 [Besnoitia besnoiti]